MDAHQQEGENDIPEVTIKVRKFSKIGSPDNKSNMLVQELQQPQLQLDSLKGKEFLEKQRIDRAEIYRNIERVKDTKILERIAREDFKFDDFQSDLTKELKNLGFVHYQLNGIKNPKILENQPKRSYQLSYQGDNIQIHEYLVQGDPTESKMRFILRELMIGVLKCPNLPKILGFSYEENQDEQQSTKKFYIIREPFYENLEELLEKKNDNPPQFFEFSKIQSLLISYNICFAIDILSELEIDNIELNLRNIFFPFHSQSEVIVFSTIMDIDEEIKKDMEKSDQIKKKPIVMVQKIGQLLQSLFDQTQSDEDTKLLVESCVNKDYPNRLRNIKEIQNELEDMIFEDPVKVKPKKVENEQYNTPCGDTPIDNQPIYYEKKEVIDIPADEECEEEKFDRNDLNKKEENENQSDLKEIPIYFNQSSVIEYPRQEFVSKVDSKISQDQIYFETQDFARCGIHAVNNLLQYSAYTVKEFNLICEQLTPSSLFGLVNSHQSIGGFYDINILERALNQLEYQLKWFNKKRPVDLKVFQDDKQLGKFFGIILNVERKQLMFQFKHWMCLRKVENHWYIFDSKQKNPELVNFNQNSDDPQSIVRYLQEECVEKNGNFMMVYQMDSY